MSRVKYGGGKYERVNLQKPVYSDEKKVNQHYFTLKESSKPGKDIT